MSEGKGEPMGWEDRPYYRDRGDTAGNPLMWLMTGSMPLFTVFGIRVRAHAMLLVLAASVLLIGWGGFGDSVQTRVQSLTVLFGIVLLHEFGHCFAARWTGGEANEILMWPLGGLAYTQERRRPWPTFVTVAGGPAVNVLICLVCGVGFYFLEGSFPLTPKGFVTAFHHLLIQGSSWLNLGYWLFWTYSISYALLLFNMIPVYPLDGGQMLQAILWKPMGYYRSMMLTLNIALVGSVLLIMIGVATLGTVGGGWLLVFIAINCFLNSANLRQSMRAEGPWAFQDEDADDYSYSASLRAEDDKPRKRKRRKASLLSGIAARRAQRAAAADQNERAAIDAILAKVSAKGMQSLSWSEKRTLKRATEHWRQRDKP